MLPGFGGHLISEYFLERFIGDRPPSAARDARRRDLVRWRRAMQTLGPASSLRALFEQGAEPFVLALGMPTPADIEIEKDAWVSSVHGAVVLLVTSWGARLDPLWRHAVVAARHRGADWCA